jgi:hypothetical protein
MECVLRTQDSDGHQSYFPSRGLCSEIYANCRGVVDEHGLLEGCSLSRYSSFPEKERMHSRRSWEYMGDDPEGMIK